MLTLDYIETQEGKARFYLLSILESTLDRPLIASDIIAVDTFLKFTPYLIHLLDELVFIENKNPSIERLEELSRKSGEFYDIIDAKIIKYFGIKKESTTKEINEFLDNFSK